MHHFIFVDKNDADSQLIAVNDDEICASSQAAAESDRMLGELKAGKSLATVFDRKATRIALRNLVRIQTSSTDDSIDFTYRDGKEDKRESISFTDRNVRNEVCACLKEATEGRFQVSEDQLDRRRVAFGPLLGLSIISLGTWGLAAGAAAIRAAGEIDISGRKAGMKKLVVGVLDWLGPTGVMIIGGSLAALTLLHLFMQLREPPRLWILQHKPHRAPGAIGMSLRYGLLAVAWCFVASLMLR